MNKEFSVYDIKEQVIKKALGLKMENKKVDFCHLHNHSHFSLLDGLSSPKLLAKTASEMGFSALALTDHGSCAGLLEFQKACEEYKIKPIMGCEFYTTADHRNQTKDSNTYHLILLAKNNIGIKNLMHLATYSERFGKYRKPRIDVEMLSSSSEGLICSTACSAGELPIRLLSGDEQGAIQFVEQYKSIFKDDFYLEIMMHKYHEGSKEQEVRERKVSRLIYDMGKKHDVKVIATNDAHYARRDDAKYHDVLLAMQTHDHIKNPKRFTFDGDEFYLRPYEEMQQLYSSVPEVLKNTMEIYEKVEGGPLLYKSEDLLPDFKVPQGYKDEAAYLKDLVKDGMKSKGFIDKPEYRARIKFEMDNIIKCGYIKYFLVLWDIISFAKRQGERVGAGRGSAVGSLVLYVLDITKLDPIKYDLLFERFINPERISPPDVDVDFDYVRRDEIYQYIYDKYGQDHCSKIGTYNTFGAKAVIRYGSKALDLGKDWEAYTVSKAKNPSVRIDQFKASLDVADRISKEIPLGPNGSIENTLKTSDNFRRYMKMYPDLLDVSRHIEGTVNSAGVHPAGIVICKNPIDEHIPLRESKGQICSQFNGPEVEELGLPKFDFLAIKTLTLIESTVKMIRERHGIDIDVDNLEPNDSKVFDFLNGKIRNMDNRGIFQFESGGIASLLRSIRVDTFEDMIVANALYRPGPLGAGVHDLYCEYKHGRKEIKFLHPKMGEVLKNTYGIMVYQEDLMKVSQELAGFTKGQSDTLRKVIGKKKIELIKKEHLDEKFIEGCKKNGISENVAKEIFKQIEFFGGYGFNRSHSCAYSFLAYQTAYLKVYYPIEFMCNLLSSELNSGDKNKKMDQYFSETTRMGICIKHTDLNLSKLNFTIEKGISDITGEPIEYIRSPLNILDGVGEKAANEIVSKQPFSNLKDFLSRVDLSKVDVRVFQKLVEKKCLPDSWEKMVSNKVMDNYHKIREEIDKEKASLKKEKSYLSQFSGGLFDDLGNVKISL